MRVGANRGGAQGVLAPSNNVCVSKTYPYKKRTEMRKYA